jgi:hypothetical protein
MAYELWDTESRNIVGDYATEQHALAIVRDVAEIDGQEAAESLALAFEDASGRTTVIAVGAELAARARSLSDEAVEVGQRRPRSDIAGAAP